MPFIAKLKSYFGFAKTYVKKSRDSFLYSPERTSIIEDLGSRDEAAFAGVFDQFRNYVYRYYDHYEFYPIGDFRVEIVNDAARHVSAAHDVLSTAFNNSNKSYAFMRRYVETLSNDRFAFLILAWLALQKREYKEAIANSQHVIKLDERDLRAQYILGEAYKALSSDPEFMDSSDAEWLKPLGYDLRGKYCHLAFERFFLNPTGEVYLCCPHLLPVSAGNMFEKPWTEIINSPEAIEIRNSILNGSYKYCNRLTCQALRDEAGRALITVPTADSAPAANADIPLPISKIAKKCLLTKQAAVDKAVLVNVGYDLTCNLACPQCRTSMIVATSAEKKKMEFARKYVIDGMLKSSEEIVVANSGDPFASRYYGELLQAIDKDKHRDLKKIIIFTNGVLFDQKRWESLSNLHHLTVSVAVSLDANSAETYGLVRAAGLWQKLQDNLQFLSQLRKENKIVFLQVRFVLQDCNHHELKGYVENAMELGADSIDVCRLVNVGTYTPEDYLDRCVFEEGHRNFPALLEILADPIFDDRRVNLSDLSHLWERVKAK